MEGIAGGRGSLAFGSISKSLLYILARMESRNYFISEKLWLA